MNSMKIYTVKDQKAEAYLQPFFAVNDAVALRMIAAAVNEEGHQFNRNAEDFTVWRVGEFSVVDGSVTSEVGICIAKAFDMIEQEVE